MAGIRVGNGRGPFLGTQPSPSELPHSVASTSSPHPEAFGLSEPRQPAFTVYVDQLAGSDSNLGNSPGAAVATVAKAAALLWAAARPGRICFVTSAAGFHVLTQTLHLPYATQLECFKDAAVTLQRTFSTPNSRSVWDAITTAAGTTVTSATATFTSSDTGRVAMIYGAGLNGGTYYGFLTFSSSTVCNLSAATAVARSASTDPNGVKLTVCGDWNRKVTDASITSGQSVVTSATASWTAADVGTELVIDGAGASGQALRSVISSVSGNTATIVGVASTTVSGKTCVIGINFGHAVCFHAASGGASNFTITDTTTGNNTIGAALAVYQDDSQQATTVSDIVFRNLRITCTDTAGAWEHDLDIDGTWAQASGGPGIRRVHYENCKFFGARKNGEYIRMAGAVHHYFGDGVMVAAPTTTRPGIALLDPGKTAGASQRLLVDVYFEEFECQGDYYCEGQFCQFYGGKLGSGVASNYTANLPNAADNCTVIANNNGGTNPSNIGGTNCLIQVGNTLYTKRDGLSTSWYKMLAAANKEGGSSTTGVQIFFSLTGSNATLGTSNAGPLILTANSAQFLQGTTAQSALIGKSAPATNATDGFPYMPVVAGAPTGTPTAQAGFVPMVFDSTNNKIWIYINGAWKGVAVA